ncbi:unnamed protein product [Paramecium pentaurelia]|uniref:Cyclic nucleotide-binding domain-containing protein n=1 Tax=Paramecium pentaurelia TaxID=43138 RepID=A0A8S1T6Y0_9CILI|nr:unnamed protein product [Paramecium pentaurelia]
MACTSKEQFHQDINELNQELKPQEQIATVQTMKLNRGGLIIKTSEGPIQFGLPPETVKDSMSLGVEVPTFYIIPTQRFNKQFGINVAEFEFPAYFNFFIKKRQVTLICDTETANSIKIVFQETLLGPKDFSQIQNDYHPDVDPIEYVDFKKELAIFAKNPMNLNEKLTSETLLKFVIFDNNVAQIGKVKIVKEEKEFTIYDNDNLLISFPDKFSFPKEYDKLLSLHKIDSSGKSEIAPPSLLIMKKMKHGKKPPSLTQNFDEVDSDEDDQEIGSMPNLLLWNKNGEAKLQKKGSIELNEGLTFQAPEFGVTVLGCSHGFDPKGSTSGYIFWINGRGIMVDPPPYTSYHLKKMGIPPMMISAIIISHCHADHDAGAFHKILDDSKVEIITTRTIMYSFLRKYSAISNLSQEQIKSLFIFRPAILGVPLNIYGAEFEFFYAFHSIPCIGFRVKYQNKSIYFSGDTFYDPVKIEELHKQGHLNQARCRQLNSPKFTEDIILHEAGVPPIHTSQTVLSQLPNQVKNRMYLVHVAAKDVLKGSGLKVAKPGIENTLILIRPNVQQDIPLNRKMDIISRIDIFDKLTLNNAKFLMDALKLEKYKEGELVIQENQEGHKFYIIESGLAKVFSDQKQNKFQRYLQTGDYFGESALIQTGRRKASVLAVTDLRVLSLDKHDFWFIFGDGFEGQGPVIEQMMQLMEARKQQAIQILFKNSHFSQLTPTQKTQLEMIMQQQDISKGQILWKKDDEATFVFFIRKGAFVFIDCDEAKLEEFDSGSFIGEINAILKGEKLTTTVKAIREGSILKIEANAFVKFLQRNPGLLLLLQEYKYLE